MTRQRISLLWTLVIVAGCEVAPDDDSADTDGTETSTGDGDGDPGTTGGACVDDSGDGDYPGLCSCEPADAPCFQGCASWTEGLTCAMVCEAQGESCVEAGCGLSTAVGGTEDCPAPGEYGSFYQLGCGDPLPAPGSQVAVYDCCCTR